MGQILRGWRIVFALALSALLIFAAYMLATGGRTPAAEASEESKLLQQIATKDSDNDGLPDWEEALYGTDPKNSDSFSLGMSDGEAVSRGLVVPKAIADLGSAATSTPGSVVDPSLPPAPAEGTLTATFTQHFLELYLAMKAKKGGAALSGEEIEGVASEALAALSTALVTAPDFKKKADLNIGGTGTRALEEYAARVEAVFLANKSSASKNELVYLKEALENSDAGALKPLASIAQSYRNGATGLAAVAVPQELAESHLRLVNSMMRLSEVISDFGRVSSDAVAAMFALQQYPEVVVAFGTALLETHTVYVTAGVSLAPSAPGAAFLSLASTVGNQQKP